MSNFILDIEKMFERQFGTKPYHVGSVAYDKAVNGYKVDGVPNSQKGLIPSNLLKSDGYGVEVWLPIEFEDLPTIHFPTGKFYLPYAVIRISGNSTIVKTDLAERKGTVKEQYSIGDDSIIIKGFFIDKIGRLFPEEDLEKLHQLRFLGTAFKIKNALTDIFLKDASLPAIEQHRVVIESFELPEVEGGRKARPFVMTLCSDSVFTLEVKNDNFGLVGPVQQ
jgi:Domain of unknown function (DUF6046)